MIRKYKKVIVSGEPLSILDLLSLESKAENCVSIDLTNAQVPFNRIVDHRFMDFKCLEEFKFPETVTVIGTESFSGCSNLRKIVLPKSLEKIKDYAFLNCPKLEVKVPSNVKIGEGCFADSKVTIIDPVLDTELEPEVPSCRFCSWFLDFMGIGGVHDKKKNV